MNFNESWHTIHRIANKIQLSIVNISTKSGSNSSKKAYAIPDHTRPRANGHEKNKKGQATNGDANTNTKTPDEATGTYRTHTYV